MERRNPLVEKLRENSFINNEYKRRPNPCFYRQDIHCSLPVTKPLARSAFVSGQGGHLYVLVKIRKCLHCRKKFSYRCFLLLLPSFLSSSLKVSVHKLRRKELLSREVSRAQTIGLSNLVELFCQNI